MKNESYSDDQPIQYAKETICAKDQRVLSSGQSHVTPIHATSSFSYESIEDSMAVFKKEKEGFVYSRFSNPTVQTVETKLSLLEGHGTDLEPGCLLTSSGLSAISTLALTLLKSGDTVITQADLYGGTTELFHKVVAKNGVNIMTVDFNDLEELKSVLSSHSVQLIYMETPSNPMLNCIDLKKISDLAKQNGVLTAVDNTFSTFYLQQPLALGVDYVVYSTTKYLNGHGNSIAGAIITKNMADRSAVWEVLKLLGTNSNPWDAWLLHNGLKTLALRLDRHCSNAMRIAEYLQDLPTVTKVNYPGLLTHSSHKVAKDQMSQYGGMLSFEIDGDMQAAVNFMNNTKLCTIAATLGNVDTLLLHPSSSSHLNVPKEIREASGISDTLIRMSVGIEKYDDLVNDIGLALPA